MKIDQRRGYDYARAELSRGVPEDQVALQIGNEAGVEFWAGVRDALDEEHRDRVTSKHRRERWTVMLLIAAALASVCLWCAAR
jgi:hypothetical protein